MKTTTTRDIQNGVYITNIKFKAWGREDISPDDEKELFREFPITIDYNLISFSDKYKYDATKKVAVQDVGGDTVSITPTSQKIVLSENFSVDFQYDSNAVLASEVTTNLPLKENVAQAKVLLFEQKIKSTIDSLIDSAKVKKDNFLTNNPSENTL